MSNARPCSVAALALLTLGSLYSTGCKQEEVAPRTSGKALVKSQARDLYESPDGAWVATLADTAPTTEPGAPQDIFLGALWLVPADESSPRRLGGEVANLPGKVLFSQDSAYIGFLASYSVRQGAGELRLARTTGGEVTSLADGVTYFAFSADGAWIAWISDGTLSLRRTEGGPVTRVTDGVLLVEFGPKSTPSAGRLLIKRSVRAGGALLLDDLATGKLTAIARGVTDFAFSPTGDGFAFQGAGLLPPNAIQRPTEIGSPKISSPDAPGLYRVLDQEAPRLLTPQTVSVFRFSPAGARIAFLTPPISGPAGDLFVSDSGPATRVATRVSDMLFAPDGSVVFIGNFSAGLNAGTLGVLPPTGPVQEIAQNVAQFSLSPRGNWILATQQVFQNGSMSYGFGVRRVQAPPTEKLRILDNGISRFVADPDEKRVAFSAHCVDAGKACSLYVADFADLHKPEQVATRIAAFDFAPNGMLVVASRRDPKSAGRILFSLGFMAPLANAPIQTLDDQVAGEFVLAGPARKRVIYLVDERGREGVYAAEMGQPPAVPPPAAK
jgi:hypothetical protein